MKCKICRKVFKNQNGVRMHTMRVHGSMGPGGGRKFTKRIPVNHKPEINYCPCCGLGLAQYK